jgi:hypothetical protein
MMIKFPFSQIHKKFRDGFSCNNIGKYVIKMLHIYSMEVLLEMEMSEMFQCERSARCRPRTGGNNYVFFHQDILYYVNEMR